MPSLENPDFLNLPAAVDALFRRAAERSFFALPIWYHVLSRYGTGKAAASRLYLDDETAPKAALVCVETAAPRRLDGLSTYYSTEHGPIYAPGEPGLVLGLARIATTIAGEAPPCHVVRLAGLDPRDAGYAGLIESFAGAGWAVFPYFDSGTWYEDARGLDFPRYLAERPTALRNTWRRRSAKLDAAGRASMIFH